ncbi:hypothetical protein KEM54_003592 [Ascosphaera aggregata]|nr:hypothetical protein KEM54_003592 [Ascosphaera aggregata]
MPPAYEFLGNRRGSAGGDRRRDRDRNRDRNRDRDRDRERERGDRYRPEHQFTFRSHFPRTASRPLLTTKRETTPELVGTAKDTTQSTRKFRPLEELSDSEEESMKLSDDDEDGDGAPPRKKRVVDTAPGGAPEIAPAPKWSNPDPYTALPPSDESHGKKKDVVKMIRKAKVQAENRRKEDTENRNEVVANADFISFDMEDLSNFMPPEDAPTGPKNDRKRTHDEAMGGQRKPRELSLFRSDGSILEKWLPVSQESPTPWLVEDDAQTVIPVNRLHNEILQFYNWVKPKDYENVIRNDLISRLRLLFQKRHYGCELYAFGSFASGLYLPIADMDLVLQSRTFMRQGRKQLCQRPKEIWSFARFLKDVDVAAAGSIEPIPHARVPIIKFVDKLTGLKVDLSFDNDTGTIANRTFQTWKSQYPVMPVIVSMIKQFLLLRGLHEVPNGGIGGFSIICLVTSFLQHLPFREDPLNLGSVLLDFFDFYGNKFDYAIVGIQFDPAGYLNKRLLNFNNPRKLTILDPNNPDNDVSRGTTEIKRVFRAFSDAHRALRDALAHVAVDPSTAPKSLLQGIIGANYTSYCRQREHLLSIFNREPRFDEFKPPPPPPPHPDFLAVPPPPPPPPENGSSKNKKRKQSNGLKSYSRPSSSHIHFDA